MYNEKLNMYLQKSLLNRLSIVHGAKPDDINNNIIQ